MAGSVFGAGSRAGTGVETRLTEMASGGCGGCVVGLGGHLTHPPKSGGGGLGDEVFLAAAAGWLAFGLAFPAEAALLYEGGDYLLSWFSCSGAVVE